MFEKIKTTKIYKRINKFFKLDLWNFKRKFKIVFKQIDEKLSAIAKKYVKIGLLEILIKSAIQGMSSGLKAYLIEYDYINTPKAQV